MEVKSETSWMECSYIIPQCIICTLLWYNVYYIHSFDAMAHSNRNSFRDEIGYVNEGRRVNPPRFPTNRSLFLTYYFKVDKFNFIFK